MASVASRMEDDELELDSGLHGEIRDTITRGNRKYFIFTFVEGIEVRAVCDGEKRGTLEDEPGLYYATASEMVSLVKEKAEGLSTSNNTNRDRFRTEILLANVTSVAKMALGRIMREWTRHHPPKRTIRRTRLRGAEAQRELRRRRRKRRRTIFRDSDEVPFAHMGPLSPREQAIVNHFRAAQSTRTQPNQLQRNEGGDTSDSNAGEQEDEEEEKEESSSSSSSSSSSEEEEEEQKEQEEQEEEGEQGGSNEEGGEGNENEGNGGEESEPGGDGESGGDTGEEGERQGDDESQSGGAGSGGTGNSSRRRGSSTTRDYDEQARGVRDEPVYKEEVVMVPVQMTFDALCKEFVACFHHLEELSVKFHDDRVRQFPPFSYQHNPLARLFSIRAGLTDLEAAHIGMIGDVAAGAQHTRNYFPASMVLSLYLKGFPDRFRDQVNSAVTVDPTRYMQAWEDVLDRIEEMLGIWGKTSDVVYMGLLSQIKKGGAKASSDDGGSARGSGKKAKIGPVRGWDRFVNSLQEDVPTTRQEEREEEGDMEAPITRSEMKSMIAAALAVSNPNSVLQRTRDQDRGHRHRPEGRRGDQRTVLYSKGAGSGARGSDSFNHRRSQEMGSPMTFHDRLRIAGNWQQKLCKEGTPRDLKLCVMCHEWHFLHVPYGCTKLDFPRVRDAKTQPFNDFPNTKEAQSILRVQDEEELRSYKQKHEGKTPREYRVGQRNQRPGHYQDRPSYGGRKDF